MVVAPTRLTTGALIANANGGPPKAPPFERSTRLSVVPLASIARPAGGGLSSEVAFPSYGLLDAVMLEIRGSFGGTVGTVAAGGAAAVIRRVTFRYNSGNVVWSISGVNYHYLFRPFLDAGYVDCLAHTNAKSAISAAPFAVDMIFPMMVNQRDPIGILLLQNKQTTLTILIEWETDANLTSTGTVTGWTATPHLMSFSVPPNPNSLPTLRYLHQVVDEERSIAGAGTVTYEVPRANTYLRLIHGAGVAQAGSDLWTRSRLRVNQSSYIFDVVPNSSDILFNWFHGRARTPGVIPYDFMSTSGLGNYGTSRDLYDSGRVTDLQTVTDVTGATTFRTVREQSIDLMRGLAA